MISAFSQLTAAQIKFHHPFTLSDLVILKCCANTTCCQQAAPPPFSQRGETHYSHWSLHSPKMLISPPWLDLFKNAIFMNAVLQQQGNRHGWGWTQGLQKRPWEGLMGLGPGQAGLRCQPGWPAELPAPWPLLPAPPPGTWGGKLQFWRQETAVSAAHGGCT